MTNQFYQIVLIFLFLGIINRTNSQEPQWEIIASPVNVTLRQMSFTDSLTGWAAGESGTIIRTTDGGSNWQIQKSTVSSFIIDIFFLNKNTGWALTVKEVFPFNTIILKTSNGGNDWVAEDFQDSSALMRTIFFHDSLHGFIGGSYISYTTDGGNSWIKAEVDSNMVSNFPVYNFNFYNRQFGYACGGRIDLAGVVWRTTNYGLNWSAQGISPDEVFDIFVFDSLNAITLSGDPEGFFGVAKLNTIDAGINWISEELPFVGLSFTIDFRTSMEGWSASGYRFFYTYDKGETWNIGEPPDSSIIYDLQFTDSLTGFAVGYNGAILKFIPLYRGAPPPDQFILYQNYPNPFNSSTVISWQLPAEEYVTLKIYNSLGEGVLTIINEYQPAGIYSISFTASSELPSGIYFYRLQTGSFNQTKKMIYLK